MTRKFKAYGKEIYSPSYRTQKVLGKEIFYPSNDTYIRAFVDIAFLYSTFDVFLQNLPADLKYRYKNNGVVLVTRV